MDAKRLLSMVEICIGRMNQSSYVILKCHNMCNRTRDSTECDQQSKN